MTKTFKFTLPNGKVIDGKIDIKKHKTLAEQNNYKRRWKREQIKIYELHKREGEPVYTEPTTQTEEPPNGNMNDTTNEQKQEPILQIQETAEVEDIKDIEPQNVIYTPFKLNISPREEGGTTTLLLGASKSGKTTKMKNIVKKYYSNDKDFIIFLMADNAFNSRVYKDMDKSIIKLDFFSEELIRQLNRIQKKTQNKYRFLLIIDDIITERNSKSILKLFLTMRNADISTIMMLQSPTLLSKNSRYNTNNVILMKFNNNESIEQISDMYLGYDEFYNLPKIHDKIRAYKEYTKDYKYIYIDLLNDNISFHDK